MTEPQENRRGALDEAILTAQDRYGPAFTITDLAAVLGVAPLQAQELIDSLRSPRDNVCLGRLR
ncbi:hypothetical protein GKE82_23915 [Conexibacter sp. W3-3-2]|uniref:hypothetical protein n=1 Tax=Conexibacter sp. W3-3-2 TaxID=2675227 RepID=UPI0012B8E595|nr:hypothetical protein [Conexibacter sp. W3-3-2]MTD47254.1 hypothetical protein [Conexibacter sp. W3-3-2]